jgi:hypothetical protein
MGRTPSGPECVEQLPGSDKAKQRVRVILQTMTGELRVHEACALLDVCEQRIRQLRGALLAAAIESVEDRPPGRPAQAEEPAEVTALREQVAQLQRELQAARLSAEVAVALPHVALSAAAPATDCAAPQKKRRTRKRRQ